MPRTAGQPNLLVLGLCVLALSADLLLGPYALRWMGINYASFGGSPFTKIHPGTYATLLMAGVYLIANDHPLRNIGRLAADLPGMSIYCLGMLIVLAYVAILRPLGDVPLILDTYLAPGLIAVVLLNATPSFTRRLAIWLIVLLAINAIVGIVEARLHVRLFPEITDDREVHEDYFRSTAFFGHPLRNAMITAFGAIIVMAADWPFLAVAGCLGIFGMGLLAFGGRTSLVLALFGCAVIGAFDLHRRVRLDRSAFVRSSLFALVATIVGTLLLAAVFVFTGFGERLVAEDVAGSSSMSRLQLFDVFRLTDLGTLVGGYDSSTIEAMTQVVGLVQIENFWINMLLLIGFAGYLVWLPAFLAGLAELWRQSGLVGRVIFVCFLITASSNNGIAKKGTVFSLAVAFIVSADSLRRRGFVQDAPAVLPAAGPGLAV